MQIRITGKQLAPFSQEIEELFNRFEMPARLLAHLSLVHDVAYKLLDALTDTFPNLRIDNDLVLFGAATHDIGKCVHKNELSQTGNLHEYDGFQILLKFGVSDKKAKFAQTHSSWSENSTFEELLVSLSDKIWKGCRNQELEDLLITKITNTTNKERWEVFCHLDDIIQSITKNADERLNWQNQFEVYIC